jgi:soluble lytic murein transglycosylase
MRFTIVLLVAGIFSSLQLSAAEHLTLDSLSSKPKSIARDFYIWQYLDGDISPYQAHSVLSLVNRMTNKIFYRYAKKTANDEIQSVAKCMQAKPQQLVNQNDDCIVIGLSTYKATKLTQSQLDKVIQITKERYPQETKIYEVLKSSIPYTKLVMSDFETFFEIFNNCGSEYRRRYFNYKLSSRKLKKFAQLSDPELIKQYQEMLRIIITDPNLNNLQKSITSISTQNLDLYTKFFAGLNFLKYKKKKEALEIFDEISKKAYFQFDRDKAVFWKYLATKDVTHLETLGSSWDVNMYTLYAKEILGTKHNNIRYYVPYDPKKPAPFDVRDPFEWIPILDSLSSSKNNYEKYINILNTEPTAAHLAFIAGRESRDIYYITPYEAFLDSLKGMTPDRKALIYALGRQESLFIPSSISTSYAMGTMQIMPFLSKALAMQMGEPYDIYSMLDPKKSFRYAHYHLDFLEKNLKHPLFIAYGYNGGIGFTNKLLKNGYFGAGEYEPFYSMETVPVKETRYYGKRVLANTVIYREKFALPTSIIRAIKTAVSPHHQ